MGRTFECTVLNRLRRGNRGEKFVLPEACASELHDALQAELQTGDPIAVVTRALKLSAALDGKLESPAAAALIRRVLKCDRVALQLIRAKILKPSALDERRAFVRREGRLDTLRAPTFGARAAADAVPLKDLLNPGSGIGPRVTRRSRG
jgi:hypothetical protein